MVLAGSITAQQRKEIPMPLVQVKLIEGVFTEDQKRQMIQKLTDAMVSIEGENMRQVTTVIVEEVKSGDWGIGGQHLRPATSKPLPRARSPYSPDTGITRRWGPGSTGQFHSPSVLYQQADIIHSRTVQTG
jgi:4-oxalocrotonate tautomerase